MKHHVVTPDNFEVVAQFITHEYLRHMGYTQEEIDALEAYYEKDHAFDPYSTGLEPEDELYHINQDMENTADLVVFTLERMLVVCAWTEAEEGAYWSTDCGEAFTLIAGGPGENGIRFCPYCARRVVEKVDGA